MEQDIKEWEWHRSFNADSRQKFEMYSCTNKQNNEAILRTFLLVSRKNCWSIITEKIQLHHKENIGFVPWEIAFCTKVPVWVV